MLKLEDLKPGLSLDGLEPSAIATLAAVVPIGECSVLVFYRTPDGTTKERLLGRADEEERLESRLREEKLGIRSRPATRLPTLHTL